jgi:enamidase
MIAKAVEMGGRVLAGTDAGCPGVEIGKGIRTELSCLANSGISPENLLIMATSYSAQACGAQEYTGKLEISHPASFGVYRKPPWENIDNLNTLIEVYFRGVNVNSD